MKKWALGPCLDHLCRADVLTVGVGGDESLVWQDFQVLLEKAPISEMKGRSKEIFQKKQNSE